MLAKSQFVSKAFSLIGQLNEIVEEIIRRSLMQNVIPALSIGSGLGSLPSPTGSNFDIKSILDKGFVWCPTPKHRTSAEKKLTKRFTQLPNSLMTKWAKVKTNIVTCLECGSYHERNTICGKCYERVKRETDSFREVMFDKQGHYKNPDLAAKEVRVVYEGETIADDSNKFKLVEVPKKRPPWFEDNLVTKVSSTKIAKN